MPTAATEEADPGTGASGDGADPGASDDGAGREESAEVVGLGDASARGRVDRDNEFVAYFSSARRAELGRTAWFLSGDALRAEELLQQALLKTYLAWPRVRGGDPAAYARRVMANARVDGWRRTRREVVTAELPAGTAADDVALVDARDALVRGLRALGTRQRRVVVLRYMAGLSEQEVADDLGISVGTVKSQAARGLARLRQVLHEHDGTDEEGRR